MTALKGPVVGHVQAVLRFLGAGVGALGALWFALLLAGVPSGRRDVLVSVAGLWMAWCVVTVFVHVKHLWYSGPCRARTVAASWAAVVAVLVGLDAAWVFGAGVRTTAAIGSGAFVAALVSYRRWYVSKLDELLMRLGLVSVASPAAGAAAAAAARRASKAARNDVQRQVALANLATSLTMHSLEDESWDAATEACQVVEEALAAAEADGSPDSRALVATLLGDLMAAARERTGDTDSFPEILEYLKQAAGNYPPLWPAVFEFEGDHWHFLAERANESRQLAEGNELKKTEQLGTQEAAWLAAAFKAFACAAENSPEGTGAWAQRVVKYESARSELVLIRDDFELPTADGTDSRTDWSGTPVELRPGGWEFTMQDAADSLGHAVLAVEDVWRRAIPGTEDISRLALARCLVRRALWHSKPCTFRPMAGGSDPDRDLDYARRLCEQPPATPGAHIDTAFSSLLTVTLEFIHLNAEDEHEPGAGR
ncbi:hypothetical protein [Streptomyces sp. NPDC001843]|uniref:hypothetical protein n=1 Tax=Streptomyces sp. NPDC001843 TaxID=3364617 RepID=UPI003696183D